MYGIFPFETLLALSLVVRVCFSAYWTALTRELGKPERTIAKSFLYFLLMGLLWYAPGGYKRHVDPAVRERIDPTLRIEVVLQVTVLGSFFAAFVVCILF